jgi:hypothetical protein
MKMRDRLFVKEIIIMILFVIHWGCGVSSNSSSTGNKAGNASFASTQSMTPGEMAKIQNQNHVAVTLKNLDQEVQKMDDGDAIQTLYAGLSDPNPAMRKKSEETLAMLVNYDNRYFNVLKQLQTENNIPDSWFTTSLILADAEKAKAKAREAELNEYMKN